MVRFVVMAAGQARRMGRDKLALPLKNMTVLGHVLQVVLETIKRVESLNPTFHRIELHVVARKPIETYICDGGIRDFRSLNGVWHCVNNPQPLSETIKRGLQGPNEEIHSYAFLPGDQVGISVQTLSACLLEVLTFFPDFLVPIYGDTVGSPVFFHKKYVPELITLQGEQGGKHILNRYPERWLKFSVEESLFQDVDTPEQYQAFLKWNTLLTS